MSAPREGAPLTFCQGCRELVRLEVDGCPICAMQLDRRRREDARARELCREAGQPIPAWLAATECLS